MSPDCHLVTVLWRACVTVLLFEGTPLLVSTHTLRPGNTSSAPLEDGETTSAPVGPVGVLSAESKDTHGLSSAEISHSSHAGTRLFTV